MLYFAYGSNLWRHQMNLRCPEYLNVGTGRLNGWRWIITTRGYASIVTSESDYVLGTVYELSEADVHCLDRFEGVATGNYRKQELRVEINEGMENCMVYIDPVVDEGEPKMEYIARINHGIRDAGLSEEYVTRYLRPFIPG